MGNKGLGAGGRAWPLLRVHRREAGSWGPGPLHPWTFSSQEATDSSVLFFLSDKGEGLIGGFKLSFFFFFLIVFVYYFISGCAESLLLRGFSLTAGSGGYSLAAVSRLLIVVASLMEHRLWGVALQELQLLGPRAQAR